jgi:GntR family transcriptional regulator
MSVSPDRDQASGGPGRAGPESSAEAFGEIDRRSPVPFFFQLKSVIADELERGRWEPGDRIPSEPEFCRLFGVSRATVRQALAELEREGRLRKEKGRGTFVAEPRGSTWLLQSSHGFFDDATEAGRTVTSRVLRRELAALPNWASSALDEEPAAEGVLLERLRSVDDEVVMYVQSFLRAELGELILAAELERSSLYHVISEGAGVEVSGGRRVVEATSAPTDLAQLLNVPAGAALLQVEAISFDQAGRPFETYRAWHRSDRTKITVQVVGSEAAATAGLAPGPTVALES